LPPAPPPTGSAYRY